MTTELSIEDVWMNRTDEYCILCGDELTNGFDRDTGVCGVCIES